MRWAWLKADQAETEARSDSRLRSGDLWAGLAVILLGAVTLYGAFDIFSPGTLGGDLLGPRAFPLALGVLLLILGATLTLRDRFLVRGEAADFGSLRTLGVAGAAGIGFLLLLTVLGFVVTATLFLVGLFTYLGERRVWLSAVLAIVVSLAIYVGFREGLNVNLPRSPFGI